MVKRKKLIVLVSILTLATALIFAAVPGDKNKSESLRLSETELSLSKLAVEGMTCIGCTYSVKAILTNVDGVESASVDYEDGSASVKFDSKRTTINKIVDALNTYGYGATQINLKSPVERNES